MRVNVSRNRSPSRFAGRLAAAFAACLLAAAAPGAADEATRPAALPSGADLARAPGLPPIGAWMMASDGGIASWLGAPLRGRGLLEPINVIVVDGISASAEEALARLEAAAADQEFELRDGHSSGYSARIGDELFEQIPKGRGKAISDGPFEFANNHGRIFGPAAEGGAWVFTAAFSRESTDLATKVKHRYVSFNQARDAFAWALDRGGAYRVASFVALGNVIIGSDSICTGDHDGLAVLLVAAPSSALPLR
jgi:hypothetical protein